MNNKTRRNKHMKKIRVAIAGATGMVGQSFVMLNQDHRNFEVVLVAASDRSAGKPYYEAVDGRWVMGEEIPPNIAEMRVYDALDVDAIAGQVDLIFSAISLGQKETAELEERYARCEIPVVSNNSAHRWTPDVPMVIPELNHSHLQVISAQRKRLGTKRGFIAVKPNCSIKSYVSAIYPLLDLGPYELMVSTYQAVSGAGKTLKTWPEMQDNVIPYIAGEEEKSEKEPLKILGHVGQGEICPASFIKISAQCVRVPVSNGHLATVSMNLRKPVTCEDIIERWRSFKTLPQKLGLPSAPNPFLTYFDEDDRPQPRLDRYLQQGMGIAIGRLREDPIFDFKFVALSHNTVRGAAGGAILLAEFLYDQGDI